MEVHEGLENTKDEAEILYMAETQQGIITSTQLTEAGIPRRCLTSMVRSGLSTTRLTGNQTTSDGITRPATMG